MKNQSCIFPFLSRGGQQFLNGPDLPGLLGSSSGLKFSLLSRSYPGIQELSIPIQSCTQCVFCGRWFFLLTSSMTSVTCTWNCCLLFAQNNMQTGEMSLRPIVNLAWRAKIDTISEYLNAKYIPEITESLKRSLSPKQSQHWIQTRLLRALSSCVLKTSKNTNILTLLNKYFFFLISSQTGLFSSWSRSSPPAWLCLLSNLPVGEGRWLLGFPMAVPSPDWANPTPPASTHRVMAPASWPTWFALSLSISFFYSGAKNWILWNMI